MATLRRFEDLDAWKSARELNRDVFVASDSGTFFRDFDLRDQIRASALSAMSNIAEGFEREGTAEFLQFLSIAKGSAGEVASLLYAALDRKHLSKPVFDDLHGKADLTRRLIVGLMNYLKRTPIRGQKYLGSERKPETRKPGNP